MSVERIWAQLCLKEPELAKPDTKVEFTSRHLKALLAQVYEQGVRRGRLEVPAIGDMFKGLFK